MMMKDHKPAEVFPPGEFLREELEARGWSQADFAEIIGRDQTLVSEIISARRIITPDTARAIGEALNTSAHVWLNLETEYRLRQAETTRPLGGNIAERAELFGRYPIRDMVKRGWIRQATSVDDLRKELAQFFYPPEVPYAARRVEDESRIRLQQAWLYRTHQISRRLHTGKYSEAKLEQALNELKTMLISSDAVTFVPRILREAGIRFLLVEALPSSKIDGVCFWLNAVSPVIAISLRFDRIDHFWFTLLHELYHVKHRHGIDKAMLDTGLYERDETISREEKLADTETEEFLIPKQEFSGFVARVQPLFTPMQVQGFSKRIRVHPGIVVGRLQYGGHIDYKQHRKMLVRVRDKIISTSTYDGWGMVA